MTKMRMKRNELNDEICSSCRKAESVFYRYSIPEDDIEDLSHEVFVAAYADIDKLKDENKLGAWIRGIARNKARKYWDEAKRKRSCSLDSEEGKAALEAARHSRIYPENSVQYETLAAEETLRSARDALTRMNSKALEIIMLHDIKGYSLKEVSEIEGIKYATVRTVYNRSKKKLREMMEDRDIPEY